MLLLISVDGASPEIIERLTSRGRLPALRAMMRLGAYGRLASSANCNPISAWASALTGVNPGKHGAWDLFSIVPGSYDWQPAHAWLLRAPPLLQLLTERGLEAGTLFVPMTFPAREAEWTTVAGWLAPSVEAHGFAHPAYVAELAAEGLADTPLVPGLRSYAASGRYQAGYEIARDALRSKCELALELLGRRDWDFLAVNFVETDRLQRWYWHLIDRAHPRHREDQPAEEAQLIEDLYADVDEAIGRLAERLAPDDQLIVLSTYGMGLNSRAADCVPEVLERLGLFVGPSSVDDGWQWLRAGASGAAQALLRGLRRALPRGLAARLPESAPAGLSAAGSGKGNERLDYAASAALPAPGGHVMANVEGEFPQGSVPPTDLAAVSRHIVSALSSAIDPATGRRPLEWARRREQLCHGPYLDRIPHVVTRWRSPRVVTGLTVVGRDHRVTVASPPPGAAPTGTPTPEGILILAGGGVNRGVRIHGARVEDVAATALHLCRAPVPSYFDGQVLTAGMAEDYLSEHPVRVAERELPTVIEDAARAEVASEAVRDHLRGLSYLA